MDTRSSVSLAVCPTNLSTIGNFFLLGELLLLYRCRTNENLRMISMRRTRERRMFYLNCDKIVSFQIRVRRTRVAHRLSDVQCFSVCRRSMIH